MKYALAALAMLVATPASAQRPLCINAFGDTAPCPRTDTQLTLPTTPYVPEVKSADLNAIAEKTKMEVMRKQVGDLLANKKCDEALKVALRSGDLAFAQQVKAFCATP